MATLLSLIALLLVFTASVSAAIPTAVDSDNIPARSAETSPPSTEITPPLYLNTGPSSNATTSDAVGGAGGASGNTPTLSYFPSSSCTANVVVTARQYAPPPACTNFVGKVTFRDFAVPVNPGLDLDDISGIDGSLTYKNISVLGNGPLNIAASQLEVVAHGVFFIDLKNLIWSGWQSLGKYTVKYPSIKFQNVSFNNSDFDLGANFPGFATQSLSATNAPTFEFVRTSLKSISGSIAYPASLHLTNNPNLRSVSIQGNTLTNVSIAGSGASDNPLSVVLTDVSTLNELLISSVASFDALGLQSISTSTVSGNDFKTLNLSQLKSVSKTLAVMNNSALQNFTLPSNGCNISGDLIISGNNQLKNISLVSINISGNLTIDGPIDHLISNNSYATHVTIVVRPNGTLSCPTVFGAVSPNNVQCTPVPTSTPSSTSTSPTPTCTSTGKNQCGSSPDSTPIGVGVGVGVGIPLIIVIAGFFWWRRSRQTRKRSRASYSPPDAASGQRDQTSKYAKQTFYTDDEFTYEPDDSQNSPTSAAPKPWLGPQTSTTRHETTSRSAQNTTQTVTRSRSQRSAQEMDARSIQDIELDDRAPPEERRSMEDIEAIHSRSPDFYTTAPP